MLEPGRLARVVGEAGAVLMHGRRGRAYCYCIKVDAQHPAARDPLSGDRIADLLLALRGDEHGLRDRRQPVVLGRPLAPPPAQVPASSGLHF